MVRIDLADQLKRDPGILKLIEKKVLSYSDFLTDGMLAYAKLARARRSLIDQVESTETSYKLAAMSKGYAPSGAAYPAVREKGQRRLCPFSAENGGEGGELV